jgi:hypothetical protein
MNNIHKWECWKSYREYLRYRYHLEVINAQVYSKRKVPMRYNFEIYEEKLKALCQEKVEWQKPY